MSTGQAMQAQAVANELAGERQTSNVRFPVTGDTETDFVSGVVALANLTPYMSPQRQKMVARALAYLSTRFHEEAAEQERQAEAIARMQQPQYPPQNYGATPQQLQNIYQSALGLGNVGMLGTSDVCNIQP